MEDTIILIPTRGRFNMRKTISNLHLETLSNVVHIKLYVPTSERQKWMGTTNIPIETIDDELEIHEIRQRMMKDNLLFQYHIVIDDDLSIRNNNNNESFRLISKFQVYLKYLQFLTAIFSFDCNNKFLMYVYDVFI